MRISQFLKLGALIIPLSWVMVASAKWAIEPPLDTDLNNFDPEVPIGYYIQKIASNTVEEVVTLTNGVLTVGNETINIAQPSHDVVVTNETTGVVTTNTYYTVYEDELAEELKNYATVVKEVYTENEDGTITTNYVNVAYLDDIPSDAEKADKIINLWEYYCPEINATLTRSENRIAPFASWSYNGIPRVDLFYTNGIWSCLVNSTPPALTIEGEETDKTLDFGSYHFSSTNENGIAYVVYTDALQKARQDFIDTELSQYVAKTNLYDLSDRIVETNLHTIAGIAAILRGIRNDLNSIAGGSGIHLFFTNVSEGVTLTLTGAAMSIPLDTVEIDWGDGTAKEEATIPCSHTYATAPSGTIEVVVSGRITEINGANNNPFASWSDGDNGRLTNVLMDRTVGLSKLGDYAFANCSNLDNLNFTSGIGIKELGDYCFSNCDGLTTLEGMPPVETIPIGCFANCDGLVALNGLPSSVKTIKDYAFSGCSTLISIGGISGATGLNSLGESAFAGCTSLASLWGLQGTQITEISPFAFSNCVQLVSIGYLPEETQIIGEGAFAYTGINSLNGIPQTIIGIEADAFAFTPLRDGKALWNTSLEYLEGNAFRNTASLEAVTLPETLSYIGANAFSDAGAASTNLPRTVVKFRGKTIDDILHLPESALSTNVYGFAWGLPASPPAATSIIAVDGELVYNPDTSAWETNSTRTVLSMRSMSAGTKVSLGEIVEPPVAREEEPDNNVVLIDWGDGDQVSTNKTHIYTSSISTPTITLMGRIDSLGGEDGRPFVCVNDSATNSYLTAVSFGNNVALKTIGDDAFANCDALITIDGLDASLFSLGERSFKGATSLASIDFLLPTSITDLPVEGFYECRSLEDINLILGHVSSIPEGCFMNCGKITSVTNTAHITSIGENAFSQCSELENVSLRREMVIGRNAFYNIGNSTNVVQKLDEDLQPYKTLVACPTLTYSNAAEMLGLQDGDIADASGLPKQTTKIVCSDGSLLWPTRSSKRRWEVVTPAIDIELQNVGNGTTFETPSGHTRAYDDASLLWNWGDGTVEWVDGSPSFHTYTNSAPQNYVIRVKGLLQSISSESRNSGPYVRPQESAANPYLVGFKLADDSPIQAIGDFTFSHCPNLKNLDTLNLPPVRSIKNIRKTEGETSRLKRLSIQQSSKGGIGYGAYCFVNSGINNLSGLPLSTTTLAEGLFEHNLSLTSLGTLPSENIIDIGANCFANTGLLSLYGFPTNIGYISPRCFAECSRLESIEDLNVSSVSDIGDFAFSKCSSLLNLFGLPPTIKTIGEEAFSGAGVQNIQDMPDSVTNIGYAAFAQCTNLRSTAGISQGLRGMGKMAFYSCTNMTDIVDFPNSLSALSDYCFLDNASLTNVVIGESITSIGLSALTGCGANVEPVEDEDGNFISATISFPGRTCSEIRELWGGDNFNTTLSTIKFKGKDGYIVYDGGKWVDKIETIEFHVANIVNGTQIEIGNIEIVPGTVFSIDWGDGVVISNSLEHSHTYSNLGSNTEATIIFTGRATAIASKDAPKPFLYSDNNSSILINRVAIGNNVGLATLGDSTFRGYSYLDHLYDMTDSSIVEIGSYCFAGCSGLRDIDGLPSAVIKIGEHAFAGCSSMENIGALSNSTSVILSPYAFYGCSSLTSLNGLPIGVTNIPAHCFAECGSLSSLEGIPTSIEQIDAEAFLGCSSLTNIERLATTIVSSIGEKAFAGCALTNLVGFPSTLVSLGAYCFADNIALRSLDGFGKNCTVIPEHCFEGCISLQSLEGISHVREVGTAAFKGCTSLSSGLGFPSLETINQEVFRNCIGLDSFEWMPESVTTLSNRVFYGCIGLQSIPDFPSSISTIGEEALGGCGNLTNLSVSTSTVLSTNALAEIGKNVELWLDEDGTSIKAIVRMPGRTIAEIKNLNNFPFGAPVDTTKFVGDDGFLLHNGDNWNQYRIALAATMDVNPGETYYIDSFSLTSNSNALVVWDDKVATNNLTQGNIRYRYNNGGVRQIKIYGDIVDVFSSESGKPFISRIVGSTRVAQNPAVKELLIPSTSSIANIGNYAFMGCNGITNIIIEGAQLIGLGESAFYGTTNITSLAWIPNSVVSLGNNCFRECSSITSLEGIPNSITSIGDYCFRESGVKTISNLAIPSTIMGEGVFYGCLELGDEIAQTWPSAAFTTFIPNSTFEGCTSLGELTIPPSCDGILTNALSNVGSALSPKVDEFGDGYNAYVYIRHKTCEEVMGSDFGSFPFGAPTNATKFVCSDGYIRYWHQWGWVANQYGMSIILKGISNGSTLRIGPTLTNGMENVIWSMGDGTTITNNNGTITTHTYTRDWDTVVVSLIGQAQEIDAISPSVPWISIPSGSGRVEKIIINNSSGLEVIGEGAFKGCSSLEDVEIDCSRLVSIGQYAFDNCTNLTTIILRSPLVTELQDSTFAGCRNLKLFDATGMNIETVGDSVFSGCYNLEKVQFASSNMALRNSNVFLDAGRDAAIKTNSFDFPYKMEVCFPNSIAEEVVSMTNFPWSANADIVFPTDDGYVGYVSSAWQPMGYGIIVNFDVSPLGYYYIGTTTPKGNATYAINWGDGSIQKDLHEGNLQHIYRVNSAAKRLIVLGEIDEIAGNIDYSISPNLNPIIKGRSSWLFEANGYAQNIKSVKIGNRVGLRTIGKNTFWNHHKLERVYGDGICITNIADYAFDGCSNLTFYVVSTNTIKTVGDYAYQGCASLPGLPPNLGECIEFGEGAFQEASISSLEWMHSNAVVKAGCFIGCPLTSLKGYPTAGDNTVPKSCFSGCSGLSDLNTLPSNITNIDDYAFNECNNMLSISNMPPRLERIGNFAFGKGRGFPAITDSKILLPSTLREVGQECFANYKCLGNITNTCFGWFGDYLKWNVPAFQGGGMVFLGIDKDTLESNRTIAYPSEDYTRTLSTLVLRDAIYTPFQGEHIGGNYPDLAAYTVEPAGIKILLTNVVAGTSFSVSGVEPVLGSKLMYDWGDGTIGEFNISNSLESAHTFAANGNYEVSIGGRVAQINATANSYPFFKPTGTSCGNAHIAEIVFRNTEHLNSIGEYALAGLPNCRRVTFNGKAMPDIATTTLTGIGANLPLETIDGTECKAYIHFPNVDAYQVREVNFPFGADTNTLFGTQDGIINHSNGAWKNGLMGYTATYTWNQDSSPYMFIGPFWFENNSHGWVKIGNEEVEIPSGWAVNICNTTSGLNVVTVTIRGRLVEFDWAESSFASLRNGRITNLSFGDACAIKLLKNYPAYIATNPSVANLPKTIQTLGDRCFADRTDLTTLTWLPSSITNIGDKCFAGCRNLQNIYGIGRLDNLMFLGAEAFKDCTKLKGTYQQQQTNLGCLPSSLLTIGENAFQNVGQGTGDFCLVFMGRTTEQIRAMGGFMWDNRIHTYKPQNGATSRIKCYGENGYWVDKCIKNAEEGVFRSQYEEVK